MFSKIYGYTLVATISLSLLTACGGGSSSTSTSAPSNTTPVAKVDTSFVNANTKEEINVSAEPSYDSDGDVLTYQWSIDNKPNGSQAVINASNVKILNFTPDLPGTYTLSLTVSDGKNTNSKTIIVQAISDGLKSIKLNFSPDSAVYSRGLDKLLIVNKQLDNLAIIDPTSKTIENIRVPDSIISVQLSPNGKLAAVLLDGQVNLVDIAQAKTIQMRTTGGQQTDAFITDEGIAYAIGQKGGQWVTPSVTKINMYTGDKTEYNNSAFYGTQKGVYASKLNKVFLEEFGISPADIDFFTLDAMTGNVITTGDSPYHGDYNVGNKLWLNNSQELVFTNAGTYFYTSSLKYAGTLLRDSGQLLSLSSSANDEELLVLQSDYNALNSYDDYSTYPISYTALTGFNFKEKQVFDFPKINGQQSYGISLFHSSTDHQVAIVQTGSNKENAAGISYYVITR